jgi:hypothetical protein
MNRFLTVPEITPLEIFIGILIISFFFVLFFFLSKTSISKKRKEKKDLINHYFNSYGLTYDQRNFILQLLSDNKFLNISHLFQDEIFFDHITNNFINKKKKSGYNKIKINELLKIYDEIKNKINFSKVKPVVSSEMRCNENIKLQIEKIGFMAGKILQNNENGIIVKTHFFNKFIQKVNKNTEIMMYCWDDNYQYEINTRIKKIINKKYDQYFFLAHNKLIIKDKYLHGMKVKTRIPVYFTHIFDPVTKTRIKERVIRGTINTFSIFGTEIYTRNKVKKGGIFLFEFHQPGKHDNIFLFTGQVDDFETVRSGRLLFIKYIDMKDKSRDYIYKYIIDKMNQLSKPDIK